MSSKKGLSHGQAGKCPYEVLGFNDPYSSFKTPDLEDLPEDEKKRDAVIKKASKDFMKASHPDKTTGSKEWFQEISDAFEKIKTSEARRAHENEKAAKRFGEHEQQIKDFLVNFQDSVNPYHVWFCFTVSLLFLISMPWIVVLQIDDTLSVPWAVALVPFWIADAVILVLLVSTISTMRVKSAASGSIAASNYMCAFSCLLMMLAIITFEVFFVLRQNEEEVEFLEDNLVLVTPLIVALCSCCILCTLITTAHMPEVLSLVSFAQDAPALWMRATVWTQCGIAQTVMIALKLNGTDTHDWIYVFIPTYVLFGCALVLHLISCIATCVECGHCVRLGRKLEDHTKSASEKSEAQPFLPNENILEERNRYFVSAQLTAKYCIFGFVELLCLLVTVACFVLLVYKLYESENDNDSMSALVVMAPVNITLLLVWICLSLCTLRNLSVLFEKSNKKAEKGQ